MATSRPRGTLGTVLGWAIVRTVTEHGAVRLVVPVGSLVTIAGVAAALMPARCAARIDILEAVANV